MKLIVDTRLYVVYYIQALNERRKRSLIFEN